ncbi:MAG: ATP-binding protein [Ilumatobacteraceae bacterium]
MIFSMRWLGDQLEVPTGVVILLSGTFMLVQQRSSRWVGALLVAAGVSWLIPNITFVGSGSLFLHRALLAGALFVRSSTIRVARHRRMISVLALALMTAVSVDLGWARNSVAVALAGGGVCAVVLLWGTRSRLVWFATSALAALIALSSAARSLDWFSVSSRRWLYHGAAAATALLVVIPARIRRVTSNRVVELGRGGLSRASLNVGVESVRVGFRAGDAPFRTFDGGPLDAANEEIVLRYEFGPDLGEVLVVGRDPSLADPVVRTALEPGVRLLATNVRLADQLGMQAQSIAASRARLAGAERRASVALANDVEQKVSPHLGEIDALLASIDVDVEQRAPIAELIQTIQQELSELAGGVDSVQLAGGLIPALQRLADDGAVEWHLDADRLDLDPVTARTLYLVACEALANSAKYARASRTILWLHATPEGLELGVEDNGCGGAAIGDRGGLRGAWQRAHELGGTFEVRDAETGGTRVTVRLSLDDVRTS